MLSGHCYIQTSMTIFFAITGNRTQVSRMLRRVLDREPVSKTNKRKSQRRGLNPFPQISLLCPFLPLTTFLSSLLLTYNISLLFPMPIPLYSYLLYTGCNSITCRPERWLQGRYRAT
uniref:Uncharacterized protein n=1 Tax=Cacopsylla melanoneura TaxID=428564 RepID=A0A8D8ZBC3_9HEMI